MKQESDDKIQERLRIVIDQEIPHQLLPEQRLGLAILRQAYVDYFRGDVHDRQTAAAYFAGSPLYLLTLRMFRKPDNWLPWGVVLRRTAEGELIMDEENEELTNLEALVRQLSGNQLKVVLTMGLMTLPAAAGSISKQCELNRATVINALKQLEMQGLVESHDNGHYVHWRLPADVDALLENIWRES